MIGANFLLLNYDMQSPPKCTSMRFLSDQGSFSLLVLEELIARIRRNVKRNHSGVRLGLAGSSKSNKKH